MAPHSYVLHGGWLMRQTYKYIDWSATRRTKTYKSRS